MNYCTNDKRLIGQCKPVLCVENDPLTCINIKDKCFLMLIVTDGGGTFQYGDKEFDVKAPCFVCFGERDNPVLKENRRLQSYAVYFDPVFLNVNMTFDRIRSDSYSSIPPHYNMFLCKPFLDDCRTVPIPQNYVERITASARDMIYELTEQRDVYWSCRSRSCLIEIMTLLDRSCSPSPVSDSPKGTGTKNIYTKELQNAVQFMEAHFAEDISYSDILKASGLGNTSFSTAFKKAYKTTPFKYLTAFRIEIAKKQVAFTAVPLKDIAHRCGFKTVQHFTRAFKSYVGETPASYRRHTVEARINYFSR